jgi:predicted ferric reductase
MELMTDGEQGSMFGKCILGLTPTYQLNTFRLRILQGDRSWESHPFTIANAPASHALSVGNTREHPSPGLLLYARAAGNFTRALNADARKSSRIQTSVIIDGPYGGLSSGMVDPADNKNVILVAGGGGASFTVAVLEDLVSRELEGKGCTKTIDFIWVVKVSLFK